MLAGMLAGCAILLIVGVGLVAVYQGLQERTRLNRDAAIDHYHKGLEQFSAENYELARAEFELALRLDPKNLDAETKLAEVDALLSKQPTPTSAVRRQTAMLLYNEARDLYNKGDWEGAIDKLEQVQVMEPEYEPEQVIVLLVDAYYKAGLRLVSENRMEEAIRYFDRALQLRPGEQAVRDEKRFASLYVAGLGYWGANWQGAIDTFNALYQLKPDYKDTPQRLRDAYVAYGDSLYAKKEWCSARDQYDSALAMTSSDELKAKREDAAQQCTIASLPTATPPPSGTYVGQLVKVEDVGSQTAMMIRGYVLNAEGKPMADVRVGLSAWDWSAVPTATNAEGLFAFDGLGNPVTYTVTLLDVPVVSLPVKADWSRLVWVEFRAQP
jgi:outer membrane protein assembly factor BamD (BamD/ComL family)